MLDDQLCYFENSRSNFIFKSWNWAAHAIAVCMTCSNKQLPLCCDSKNGAGSAVMGILSISGNSTMKGGCKMQLSNACCGLLSPVSEITMVCLLKSRRVHSVIEARRNLTQDGNSKFLF